MILSFIIFLLFICSNYSYFTKYLLKNKFSIDCAVKKHYPISKYNKKFLEKIHQEYSSNNTTTDIIQPKKNYLFSVYKK